MPMIAERKNTHPHYFRFANGKPFEVVPASGNGMIRIRVKAGEGDYAEYEFHKTTGALSLFNSSGALVASSVYTPTYLDAGNRVNYTLGTPTFSGSESGDFKRVTITYPLRRAAGGGPVMGSMSLHFDVDLGSYVQIRKQTVIVTANDPANDPQVKWTVSGLASTEADPDSPEGAHIIGNLIVDTRQALSLVLSSNVTADSIEYVYGGHVNGVLTVDPDLALSVASNVFTLTNTDKYRITTVQAAVDKTEAWWNGGWFTLGDRTSGRGSIYAMWDGSTLSGAPYYSDNALGSISSTTILNTDTIAAARLTGSILGVSNYRGQWVLWAGKNWFIYSHHAPNLGRNWTQYGVSFTPSSTAAWGTNRQTTDGGTQLTYESFYYGNAAGEGTIGFGNFHPRTGSTGDWNCANNVAVNTGIGDNISTSGSISQGVMVWFSEDQSLANAQTTNAKYRVAVHTPPNTTAGNLTMITGSTQANDTTSPEYRSAGFDYQYGAIATVASGNVMKCTIDADATYDMPFTCFIINSWTDAQPPVVKVGSTVLDGVGDHTSGTEYLGTTYNAYVDTTNDIAYVVIFDDQPANTSVTYEFNTFLVTTLPASADDELVLEEGIEIRLNGNLVTGAVETLSMSDSVTAFKTPSVSISVNSDVFTITSDDRYRFTTVEMAVGKAEAWWGGGWFTCGERSTGRGAIFSRFLADTTHYYSDSGPSGTLSTTIHINSPACAAGQFDSTDYGAHASGAAMSLWVAWAGKPWAMMTSCVSDVVAGGSDTTLNVSQHCFALSDTPAWGTARSTGHATDYEAFYYGNAEGEGTIGFHHLTPRAYSTSYHWDYCTETVTTTGMTGATVGVGSNDSTTGTRDIRLLSQIWFSEDTSLAAAQATNTKYRGNVPPTTGNSRLTITTGTAVSDLTTQTQHLYREGAFDYNWGAYRITASSNTIKVTIAATATQDCPWTCFIIEGYTASTAPVVKRGSTLLDDKGAAHSGVSYNGFAYASHVDTTNDVAYVVVFADIPANTSETYEIKPNFATAHTKEVDDTQATSESVVKQAGPVKSDTQATSEAVTKAPGKDTSETQGTSEALTKEAQPVRSDTQATADARISDTSKVASDTASLAEARVADVTKAPIDETQASSDAVPKLPDKAIAETQSWADSLLNMPGKVAADAQATTETLLKLIDKLSSDSATVTDARVFDAERTFTETASPSDAVPKDVTKAPFEETATMSDLINAFRAFFKEVAETLSGSEAILKAVEKSLAETQGTDDASVKDVSGVKAETLSASDAAIKDFFKVRTETLSTSDTVQRVSSFLRELADTLSGSDAIPKNAVKAPFEEEQATTEAATKEARKVSLDGQVLADARSWSLDKSLAEAVSALDERIVDFIMSPFALTLSLEDDVGRGRAVEFEDALSFTDAFLKNPDKLAAEAWSLLEAKQFAISAFRDDAASMTDERIVDYERVPILETVSIGESTNVLKFLLALAEDTLSAIDALIKDASAVREDTATMTDAAPTEAGKVVSDEQESADELDTHYIWGKVVNEAIEAAEALVWDVFRTLAETLFFIEFRSLMPGKNRTETLSMAEAFPRVPIKTAEESFSWTDDTDQFLVIVTLYNEALSLVEEIAKLYATAKSESIGSTEAFDKLPQPVKSESLSLTEANTAAIAKPISEAVSLVETLAKIVTLRTFSEAVALIESVLKMASKPREEAVSLSESFTKTPSPDKSEAISLAEGMTKDTGKNVNEPLSLVELLSKAMTRTFELVMPLVEVTEPFLGITRLVTDTLTLTETTVNRAFKAIGEALGSTDASDRLPHKVSTDPLSMTEAKAVHVSAVRSDTATMVEAMAKVATRAFAEAIAAADAVSKMPNKIRTEIQNFGGDVWTRATGKVRTETASLTETLSKAIAATRTDALSTFEDVTKRPSLLKSETQAMSEAVTRVWGYVRTFTESLSSAETWTKLVNKLREEGLTLSDLAALGKGYFRTFTEEVTPDENVTKTPNKVRTEIQNFAEAWTRFPSKVVTQTLVFIEALTKQPRPTRTDAVTGSDAASKHVATTKSELQPLSEVFARSHAAIRFIGEVLTSADVWTRLTGLGRSDTLSTSDSATTSARKAISDSLTSSDAITRITAFSKVITDPILMIEVVSRLFSFIRTVNETLILSEITNASGTIRQILEDALSLTLAVVKTPNKAAGETIPLSDSLVKMASRLLPDTLGTLDALTKRPTKVTDTTLSLAEAHDRLPTKVAGETVSVSESLVKDQTRRFTEVMTTLDRAAKDVVRGFAEAFTLSETATRRAGKVSAETQGSSDALTKGSQPVRSDALTGSDSLTKLPTKLIWDNGIPLFEAVLRDTGKVAVETAGVGDAIVRFIRAIRTDSVTLGDVEGPRGYGKVVADQLKMLSMTVKDTFLTRVEALSLADLIANLHLDLIEVLGLADALSFGRFKVVTEVLTLSENSTLQRLKELLFKAAQRLGFLRATQRVVAFKAEPRQTTFRASGIRSQAAPPRVVFFRASKR